MRTNKPGLERNFFKVLFLTIITLGVYFLYWLYRNLTEMEVAFEFEKNEKQILYAKRFYGAAFFIVLVYFISLVNISYENPMNMRMIFIYSLYFNLIFTGVGLFFFYFFIKSVFLCQSKINLAPFNKKTVYSLYIIRFVLDAIISVMFFYFDLDNFVNNLFADNSNITLEFLLTNENIRLFTIMSLMNNAGLVVLLLFLYRLQVEINAIWKFYKTFE